MDVRPKDLHGLLLDYALDGHQGFPSIGNELMPYECVKEGFLMDMAHHCYWPLRKIMLLVGEIGGIKK